MLFVASLHSPGRDILQYIWDNTESPGCVPERRFDCW